MFKLISKFLIIILITLILSIILDFFYREKHGLDYTFPRNFFIHKEIPEKYELVKLGNSHSGDGLTFQKYKNIKYLDLSFVAQSYEYDLVMLKMHKNQIKKDAVILINVTPISFSQIKHPPSAKVNYSYYDGRLSPFLIPQFSLSEYLQAQIFPFLRSGYFWRDKHSKYVKERAMSTFVENWREKEKLDKTSEIQASIQTKTPDEFVRSELETFNVHEIERDLNAPFDPSNQKLIDSMNLIYQKWYFSGDFGEEYFETNRKDLQEIIDFSIANEWRPVLISFPISQVLVDGLKPDYLDLYMYNELKKVDTKNIPFFDFLSYDNLRNNQYIFMNSDHLNKRGAAVVSYLLLQKLIEINYISEDVDGYDYTIPLKKFL